METIFNVIGSKSYKNLGPTPKVMMPSLFRFTPTLPRWPPVRC